LGHDVDEVAVAGPEAAWPISVQVISTRLASW
jgi:hypothetical protein